jgi:hypothetical protein
LTCTLRGACAILLTIKLVHIFFGRGDALEISVATR